MNQFNFIGSNFTVYPTIDADCPHFFLTGKALHFMAQYTNVYTTYLAYRKKDTAMLTNTDVSRAMKIHLDGPLPQMPVFHPGIRRAPDRGFRLSRSQTAVALKNALRYVPEQHHAAMIPEFLTELKTRGRIYGYRFRPHGEIRALPIEQYRGNCLAGRAFQLMMDNNLDVDVALYPYELVT
jgi:urocanate hydratase